MELLFIALVLLGIFAWLGYPFFTSARERVTSGSRATESLLAQRDAEYAALRDLDFDFQLGKLSARDYETLRAQSKLRAARVLQAIDAQGANDPHAEISAADDWIERAVARLRAQTRAELNCGNCATPYQAGDKFCRRCGNAL